MEEVANPALKERHWKQIFTLLGQPYSSEVPFSTNDLLSYDIMSKIEEVKILAIISSLTPLSVLNPMNGVHYGL
jgi:dynein heavy chain